MGKGYHQIFTFHYFFCMCMFIHVNMSAHVCGDQRTPRQQFFRNAVTLFLRQESPTGLEFEDGLVGWPAGPENPPVPSS